MGSDPLSVVTLTDENSGVQVAQCVSDKENVRHVPDAYRLVASFAQQPSDVVVVDLDFLQERDLELFRVLRDIRGDVLMYALFSMPQREMVARALTFGVDAYLLKPLYTAELTALLDRGKRRPATEKPQDTAAERPAGKDEMALARLAAGIARDVQRPVAAIRDSLRTLIDDTNGNDPNRKTYALMSEEAERIAGVVRDLLAFGQQRKPQKAPVDLNVVVTEAIAKAASLQEPNTHVVQKLTPMLPIILGDPEQLREVCESLLRIATRTNGSREITVATESNAPEAVSLSIRSPKLVIPQDELNQLSEPFFQTSPWGQSPGLGLAATYSILASHGGELNVESDERSGTIFRVRLPISV